MKWEKESETTTKGGKRECKKCAHNTCHTPVFFPLPTYFVVQDDDTTTSQNTCYYNFSHLICGSEACYIRPYDTVS